MDGSSFTKDMRQEDLLSETASAVMKVIAETGGRGALIGGIAFGLTVLARATKDVDALILVDLDEPGIVWRTASQLGFSLRSEDALHQAKLTRFLRLVYEPTGVAVDFQVGIWQFDYDVIERSQMQKLEGVDVNVICPEDLIIMKSVAGRPQDLADIDRTFEIRKDLDKSRIRMALIEFREFVEHPETIDQIISKYL